MKIEKYSPLNTSYILDWEGHQFQIYGELSTLTSF